MIAGFDQKRNGFIKTRPKGAQPNEVRVSG
jgi:hypothetical protein